LICASGKFPKGAASYLLANLNALDEEWNRVSHIVRWLSTYSKPQYP